MEENIASQEPQVEQTSKYKIDQTEFDELKSIQDKTREVYEAVGQAEEQKISYLNLLNQLKKDRESKAKEIEIRYRIPTGCNWRINPDTHEIIFFDKDGNAVSEPVVVKEA